MEEINAIPRASTRPRKLAPSSEAGLTVLWIERPNDREATAKSYGLSRRGALGIVRRFLKENPNFVLPKQTNPASEVGGVVRDTPCGATDAVATGASVVPALTH